MYSFVNIQNPAPALSAERTMPVGAPVRQGFSSTRGLSTLLLSAMVAATMVVAYEVMDSVAEGHLLVMWMVLWAVAFAALALFAGASRQLAGRLKNSLDAWSRRVAQSRSDQRLWAIAQQDPRVMADLQAAIALSDIRTDAGQPAWGEQLVKLNAEQLRIYSGSFM